MAGKTAIIKVTGMENQTATKMDGTENLMEAKTVGKMVTTKVTGTENPMETKMAGKMAIIKVTGMENHMVGDKDGWKTKMAGKTAGKMAIIKVTGTENPGKMVTTKVTGTENPIGDKDGWKDDDHKDGNWDGKSDGKYGKPKDGRKQKESNPWNWGSRVEEAKQLVAPWDKEVGPVVDETDSVAAAEKDPKLDEHIDVPHHHLVGWHEYPRPVRSTKYPYSPVSHLHKFSFDQFMTGVRRLGVLCDDQPCKHAFTYDFCLPHGVREALEDGGWVVTADKLRDFELQQFKFNQ
eukprot:TRINITY_DN267_c0_g1_i2.p1 TRINITY_DN267_c0_g1~~TRINITY_DN267_c0_g1_i2.p1  ORF type:complete len:292 (+),score=48.17 TRINITY_DN267_c0_g1_i2:2-877(+)